MSYDDGRVACTDDAVLIRGYYFPFGEKRVPYASIQRVTSRPMRALLDKWRIWGSSDLRHWYNYDPERPSKNTVLVLTLGRGVRPAITPERPDEVVAELEAHGVSVTTS